MMEWIGIVNLVSALFLSGVAGRGLHSSTFRLI